MTLMEIVKKQSEEYEHYNHTKELIFDLYDRGVMDIIDTELTLALARSIHRKRIKAFHEQKERIIESI